MTPQEKAVISAAKWWSRRAEFAGEDCLFVEERLQDAVAALETAPAVDTRRDDNALRSRAIDAEGGLELLLEHHAALVKAATLARKTLGFLSPRNDVDADLKNTAIRALDAALGAK